MQQFQIALTGFVLLLGLAARAPAQDATALSMKLSLSDDIRRRYGVSPQDLPTFENSISVKLCELLQKNYWYQFCWRLSATDDPELAKNGEIRITLDFNRTSDNWIMVLEVERKLPPAVKHSFDPVDVLDPGELNLTHGPLEKDLPDRLAKCLHDNYLSETRMEALHSKLRGIPIAEGIPVVSMSPPPPEPHGAVLLSWMDYSQFRDAKFRFECTSQSVFQRWEATGTGGPLTVNSSEVLGVKPKQPVPPTVTTRGSVFLEKFKDDDDDNTRDSGFIPVPR